VNRLLSRQEDDGVATPDTLQRRIEFARCFNFRDLGGYATRDGRMLRWRKLYRSMTPEFMSAADAEAARDLNIELVIDLRGPRFPTSGPFGEPPARRVTPGRRRALIQNPEELKTFLALAPEDALPRVLDRMGPAIAKSAALIAEAPGAVLVHCRLGKDRTGVFCATLLKLLGVDDETIIADYLLSAETLDEAHSLLRADEPADQVGMGSRVANEPPKREAMQAVLARLEDQYGGAEAYFRANGLSGRRIAALRRNLLD
jgi:protein tyrosine/serine phosphatase